MLQKDPNLKRERGYIERKSYVRNDGSEVLYGLDWRRRKVQLWERCGGKCEYIITHGYRPLLDVRCQRTAEDPHHKVPRSKRRDDRISNLIALCRYHHRMIDERKIGGRK